MNSKNSTPSARATLLAAAASLFREKGYDRTTVRDLAKAVGLQSGSLFYHFSSKDEILLEVMLDGISATTKAGRDSISNITDPRQQLRALTKSHLTCLLGSSQDALAVMLYEWRSLAPESQSTIIKMRDAYESIWTAVLEEAQKQGIISGNLAVRRRYLLGALNWSSNWYRHSGTLSVDELTDEMIAMLFG